MDRIIEFDEKDVFPLAHESFIHMCGFGDGSEKHKRMLAHGMGVREQGLGNIRLKALLSAYDAGVVEDGQLQVGKIQLRCDSIALIERSLIKKVYFYLITAGECTAAGSEILERLYADFWGTAYVDAAFKLLCNSLAAEEAAAGNDYSLSDCFGPGYYGMPTEEIVKFFSILDGGRIGIECKASGLMVPLKSCAGILFLLEKGAAMPAESCRDCTGNPYGCQLCRVKKT